MVEDLSQTKPSHSPWHAENTSTKLSPFRESLGNGVLPGKGIFQGKECTSRKGVKLTPVTIGEAPDFIFHDFNRKSC